MQSVCEWPPFYSPHARTQRFVWVSKQKQTPRGALKAGDLSQVSADLPVLVSGFCSAVSGGIGRLVLGLGEQRPQLQ